MMEVRTSRRENSVIGLSRKENRLLFLRMMMKVCPVGSDEEENEVKEEARTSRRKES